MTWPYGLNASAVRGRAGMVSTEGEMAEEGEDGA
jgi:hypothetical protein